MVAPNTTVRPDPWLGERLGLPAGHLVLDAGPMTATAVETALASYQARRSFVDARVDAARQDALYACEEAGLRLMDTNLRLVREGRPDRDGHPGGLVRPARPGDRLAVAAIAGSAFSLSRFHRDQLVPPGRADALKAAWAGNYFDGARGNGMVVAEIGDAVAGFLLYIKTETAMIIDLIAVDEVRRGRGLGAALVAAAALDSGSARLVTGTQAVNVPAVRFYENLGFRLDGVSHILHFHGIEDAHRVS